MLKFNNTWETHPHMTALLETEIYERRRRSKGMSQYVLAEKTKLSRNCIYLMECHEHIPKIESVFDIMEALDFSMKEREAFAVKYMKAYYKDKAVQKQLEKEHAGAV